MNHPPVFDLLHSPLDGRILIEASAGTGKTYTIAGLYLRLVIEADLGIEEILVVTFTEAATAELKDRIRRRLQDAEAAFERPEAPVADPFLSQLRDRMRETGAAGQIAARLREAAAGFDEAAIFTIHGFCNRILTENAFESGVLFDSKLVADDRDLVEEMMADLWRKRIHGADMAEVRALYPALNPEKLHDLARKRPSRPDIRITPEAPESSGVSLADLEKEVLAAHKDLRREWRQHRDEITALLESSETLNRKKYNQKSLPGWFAGMDRFLGPGGDPLSPVDQFAKFTASALAGGTKKNQVPPAHPFFGLADAYAAAHDALISARSGILLELRHAALRAIPDELPRRKQEAGLHSYDDMLTRLYLALTGPGGVRLAAAIRKRYAASLIDEFQDTDAVQYEIFRRIFTQDSRLFLIGDPKQAIYAFRGADIFTYLKARKETDHAFTLDRNWRSEPALVHGINALFSSSRRPFLREDIPFYPVRPPDGKWEEGAPRLTLDERPLAGLQFQILPPPEKKIWNTPPARQAIQEAMISRIADMVWAGNSGRLRIGTTGVRPGDMAVLVRSRRQGRDIQRSLSRAGVPAVMQAAGDIFQSREAQELPRILAAVEQPGQGSRIKAALATDLMGWTAGELSSLFHDLPAGPENGIPENHLSKKDADAVSELFFSLSRRWRREGVLSMIWELMEAGDIPAHLMRFPDGERRLTNFSHLAELLHQAETESRRGPSALIKWFEERRSGHLRREEHPLRLESDENAVKILTMHISKGLEYPIVFCPFSWGGGSSGKPDAAVCHDPDNDFLPVMDLGSGDWNRHDELKNSEILAENLRLLYVALTRAKHLCVVYWGKIKEQTPSSLTSLLFMPEDADWSRLMSEVKAAAKGVDHDRLLTRLMEIAACGREKFPGGTLEVSEMGTGKIDQGLTGCGECAVQRGEASVPGGPMEDLVLPECRINPVPAFRVTSFSGLTRKADTRARGGAAENAAGNGTAPAAGASAAEDAAKRSILDFPRGARPGSCLHYILERVDFCDPGGTAAREAVRSGLARYGYDPEVWADAVGRMVDAAAHAEIRDDGRVFRLADIPGEDRLCEMPFYFPVRDLTPGTIRAAFGGEAPPSLSAMLNRLEFPVVNGYIQGFIDLVFRAGDRWYLIDWKSSHLGGQPGDYAGVRLAEVMAEHFYPLQAAIYRTALIRYVKRRSPSLSEDSVGPALYVFLRGISATRPPAGWFPCYGRLDPE